MNNKSTAPNESAFQKVCKVLDTVFVEGLGDTRENAGLWEEWEQKRDGLARSLFAGVAFAPMLLVTFIICDSYRSEVGQFPDLMRVVLVESVFLMAVLYHQAFHLTRCVMFRAWLKLYGHI